MWCWRHQESTEVICQNMHWAVVAIQIPGLWQRTMAMNFCSKGLYNACPYTKSTACSLVFKVLTLKRHFQGFFNNSDYLATYLNWVLGPTWTWHWWQSLLQPGDHYEDSDHYCLFQQQNYCSNLPVRMKMYLKTRSNMFENKYKFPINIQKTVHRDIFL